MWGTPPYTVEDGEMTVDFLESYYAYVDELVAEKTVQ